MAWPRILAARPRLAGAAAIGIAAFLLLPGDMRWSTRVLAAWDVGVWIFLAFALLLMLRADQARVREAALLHAEGAAAVLAIVVAAACASIGAIVVELAGAKDGVHEGPHLLFALSTIVGSWLLLPVLFTMNYASLYHASEPVGGLRFPEADHDFQPDYTDFLYFALTIAVASQTSDVAVVSRPLRRLVLLQSLLSFAFNTTILALTINIAAGLF